MNTPKGEQTQSLALLFYLLSITDEWDLCGFAWASIRVATEAAEQCRSIQILG